VKDNLVGEFELDIDIVSGQQQNEEIAKRQILEVMNFLFSPVVEQALAAEGMKVDKTRIIKSFLQKMNQYREAQDLVVSMTPEEQQAFAQRMMMQSDPKQMAVAPQSPSSPLQGEPQSFGEMVASERGTL
jgi:hypothetical protein